MSKFEDFDLDLKNVSGKADVQPQSITTGYICDTTTLTWLTDIAPGCSQASCACSASDMTMCRC